MRWDTELSRRLWRKDHQNKLNHHHLSLMCALDSQNVNHLLYSHNATAKLKSLVIIIIVIIIIQYINETMRKLCIAEVVGCNKLEINDKNEFLICSVAP